MLAAQGVVIAGLVYTATACLTGNASKQSFMKAILTGAITGALFGGNSQLFSPGFWGAVAQGAVTGAAGGAIDAIVNGNNLLKGLATGAVIGGAMGGVTYSVRYLANGSYNTKYLSRNDLSNTDDLKYDPTISNEEMQKNVNTMRANNFSNDEINQFGVGTDTVGTKLVDAQGYLNPGNGQQQFGYTTPKNFITGKSDITYAPIAAQNRDALALTMLHETGHAYFNALGLKSMSIDLKNYNIRYSELGDTEHFAIYKLEAFSAAKNRMYIGLLNSVDRMNVFYGRFKDTPIIKSLIDNTYNKLFPIFNRIIK